MSPVRVRQEAPVKRWKFSIAFSFLSVPVRLLLTGKAAGDILIKNEPLRPPAASGSPDGRVLGKTENLPFSPEPPLSGEVAQRQL